MARTLTVLITVSLLLSAAIPEDCGAQIQRSTLHDYRVVPVAIHNILELISPLVELGKQGVYWVGDDWETENTPEFPPRLARNFFPC